MWEAFTPSSSWTQPLLQARIRPLNLNNTPGSRVPPTIPFDYPILQPIALGAFCGISRSPFSQGLFSGRQTQRKLAISRPGPPPRVHQDLNASHYWVIPLWLCNIDLDPGISNKGKFSWHIFCGAKLTTMSPQSPKNQRTHNVSTSWADPKLVILQLPFFVIPPA